MHAPPPPHDNPPPPQKKNTTQDPNPEDPLNKEAAAKFQESSRSFELIVQRAIRSGSHIDGHYFPPCTS
jgi:hypothetical protein